jgi:hypothetical protein
MKSISNARVVIALVLMSAGCASNSLLFHSGPRPAELTGVWIDVEKSSPVDTSAWLLAPNGDDKTLHFVGTKTSEKRYASWYMAGTLSDTAGRALCFQKRPRDGATCRAFRLDTLAGRRRLTVLGYPGAHHVSERVLIERLP